MANDKLARIIDEAFEGRDKIGPKTKGAVRKAVNSALDLLDGGTARVAERNGDGQWQVNQWLKKAVLLSLPQRHECHPRRARQGRMVG